jgi:hypothetical protein
MSRDCHFSFSLLSQVGRYSVGYTLLIMTIEYRNMLSVTYVWITLNHFSANVTNEPQCLTYSVIRICGVLYVSINTFLKPLQDTGDVGFSSSQGCMHDLLIWEKYCCLMSYICMQHICHIVRFPCFMNLVYWHATVDIRVSGLVYGISVAEANTPGWSWRGRKCRCMVLQLTLDYFSYYSALRTNVMFLLVCCECHTKT